ncbi:hypothetical protein JHK82_043513 [Glycine max]|uniref:UBX domain-containing protein n=1 Tax=Glycine max TaxID=3847 RepID=A0A0R0G4U7_SOYBN|nr:hypothetical protein JHK87_043295 [Glycine soja]KAG4950166.1 hypothetical protein JHK86_043405 [Glycine max]KAG4957651.1 hypothetical protein JHK85_044031 [Glycine max]KAG5106543.1 hypothetical protein JHK82_043513 [Glycine max]KAG5117471.1 hypothetical protein JHK84_043584 [Glycine max]
MSHFTFSHSLTFSILSFFLLFFVCSYDTCNIKHGGNLCKALKGFLEEGSIDIPSEEELDLAINTPQDDSPGASNQNPLSQSSASPVSPRRKSLGQRMKEAYKAWKKKNAGASSSQQKDVPKIPLSPTQKEQGPNLGRHPTFSSLKGANDPDLLNEDPAITERKAKEREAYHERICRDYRNIERVIRISVILPDKLRIARIFSKREKLEEVFEFVNIVGLGESLSTAYRLVTESPRRCYSIEDGSSTLDEIGFGNGGTFYVEKI